ncbi:MAG: c-type cytochrome [Candidatus Dadabacteria bacterium]|nr:cytochrome c [Candidatus Dadabacteria bacterium]NIY22119.1 c-type cytochrome [Candidatus Dadabacteria bacterium]
MKLKFACFIVLTLAFTSLCYSQTNTPQLSGNDLFMTNRCANCHTIGRGTFVGPDLLGVHKKYSKDEIINWMVNSQDIYKQKNKMPINEGFPPMPPMNVIPEEAELIYGYLKDFKIPADRLQKGIIKGVVSNETLKDNISEIEVKLTSFLGDIPRDEFTAKTDSSGKYIFKDLSWERSYVLSLVFKGVEYATGKLVFFPEESTKTLDLPVFDTSTDDSLIMLDSSHTIIQIEGGRAAVAELSVFKNGSNSVYIGSNDIDDEKRETLRFNIPKNADSIQFHHGLTDETAIIKEGELTSTLSVQPGISRVVFSYEIPVNRKTEIHKKLNYLTNSQLVLISDNGYKTSVKGLEGGESIEMNNQNFFKWNGEDLNKGHDVQITISKPLFGDNFTKWLILLGVIIVIAASVGYSVVFKSKNEYSPLSSKEKRDHLIKEIAELDDRFEAGDVEEEEYKKLREVKKNKLIELSD